MNNYRFVLVSAVLACPTSAQTNGTYRLTSSNVVSSTSPTTTIGIWATWNDPARQTQFVASNYDITAGDGLFSNPTNVLNGPGSSAGVANGNSVTGGANALLWIQNPPLFILDNPILLASYSWTTTDFSRRQVNLSTSNTSIFLIGDIRTGGLVELFPNNFTPGSGTIIVVPAPAVWFMLPLIAARRRRR